MLRFTLAALLCLLSSAVAVQDIHDCLRVDPLAVRVKDGDTVAIEGLQFAIGDAHVALGELDMRLNGIVAPEHGKGRAACAAEEARGLVAAERLKELIMASDVIEVCPTQRRSFERFVGTLRGDGERLGLRLVAERLASSDKHEDWCRNPK